MATSNGASFRATSTRFRLPRVRCGSGGEHGQDEAYINLLRPVKARQLLAKDGLTACERIANWYRNRAQQSVSETAVGFPPEQLTAIREQIAASLARAP
jgi:hypothetical protein